MVLHKDQCLDLYSSYSRLKILIKPLRIHIVDDTNLLYCNKSLKEVSKHASRDLKDLGQWLRSKKI